MRVVAGMALAAVCAGCAGSETQMRLLEKDNVLQIEPSQTKDFDYIVRMKNALDIGYDPDNPESRNSMALRAIQSQCPGARIVGEKTIDKGTYLGGRPVREYFVQMKCA